MKKRRDRDTHDRWPNCARLPRHRRRKADSARRIQRVRKCALTRPLNGSVVIRRRRQSPAGDVFPRLPRPTRRQLLLALA